MPATTRSRILNYQIPVSLRERLVRLAGLHPSRRCADLDESFLRIGPIGQLAEQSVIVGQLANHRTYAGSRRATFHRSHRIIRGFRCKRSIKAQYGVDERQDGPFWLRSSSS